MNIRSMMRRSLRRTSLPQTVQDAPADPTFHNESGDRDRAHHSTSRDGSSSQELSTTTTAGLLHMRLHGLGDPRVEANEKLHHDCVICSESFLVGDIVCRLPCCRHFYHSKCIVEWLSRNCSCPMCRQAVDASTPDVAEQLLEQRSPIKQNLNNDVFRSHPNFDLIMRRVLRAQKERRAEQKQNSNERTMVDTIGAELLRGNNRIETDTATEVHKRTRRTTFSGNIICSTDWFTNDLELYLLSDEEE